MRLIQALSEGSPTSDSSAINRSGKTTVRVVNVVGAPGLTAYEVDEANPGQRSTSGPLWSGSVLGDLENFLAEHGYNLDPEKWYPG
jgi:hypothetical protein